MASYEELVGWLAEIKKQKSDRGAALIACSFLDSCLTWAILSALPNQKAALKLFEDREALRSLSAKISMAYALNLYGTQTHRNLNILREIRNFFAHEMAPLNFKTPEIAQACGELIVPDPHFIVPVGSLKTTTAREQYLSTALAIGATVLMNITGTWWEGEAEERKPTPLP